MATTEPADLLGEVRANRSLISSSRRIRRAAGITQARMAVALGVDRTTLVRWEAGTMWPRPAQLERWRRLLCELENELSA